MKSVVRLDTEHVASLVSSINDLGFCLSEAKGIAVELIGSNAEDIRKYNSSLIQESAGVLGKDSFIRYASLSGSHGNFAARAVLSCAKRTDNNIIDASGFISHEKVNGPWLKHARAGWQWVVIRAEVLECFAEVSTVIQAAGNAVQAQSKVESELQLLSKCLHAISSHPGKTVEWSQVEEQVMRSRPIHKESIPFIFLFGLNYSGGKGSQLCKTTEAMIQSLGGGLKSLGPETWDAISQSSGAANVEWRHMILRTCFASNLTPQDATCLIRFLLYQTCDLLAMMDMLAMNTRETPKIFVYL